jgi:hypothetical protein
MAIRKAINRPEVEQTKAFETRIMLFPLLPIAMSSAWISDLLTGL